MYAVIQTGSKQYTVKSGSVVEVEKLEGQEGDGVTISEVLLVNDGDSTKIGQPFLEGASVKAKIVAQTKGEKLISFKKWRRNGKQWKKGHRQLLTCIEITDILG